MMSASGTSRSLNDGTIRKDAASNFHSGNVAPSGFVQHVLAYRRNHGGALFAASIIAPPI